MQSAIERNDWKVHWKVSESSGLEVYLADYRGRRALWEGSLPYVTIDHQPGLAADEEAPDPHGPFWTPLGLRTQASEVRLGEFRGGFELAVDFAAGPYRYCQMWRFHDDGRFGPWLTIQGAGIHEGHTYHPHWRFDFDVDGALDDSLEYFEDGGWRRVNEEGWLPYTGHSDEGVVWRQIDRTSGAMITMRPHQFEDAELYALRYHQGEGPPFTPRNQAGSQPFPAAYVGADPIEREDVTLWYIAHIHYDAAFPFTAGPWLRCVGF